MTNYNVLYIYFYFYTQVRKRNKCKGKRIIMNKVKQMSVKNDILPVFDCNVKCTPHVLMELSTRSYLRHKSNSIQLKGVNINKGCISYDNVVYGNNIRPEVNNETKCNGINLHEIKKNYILIVINRDEITNHPYFRNIITLQHGLRCYWNDNEDHKHNPSGMLVVLIAKLKKKTINDSFLCCEKHGEAIKECKSSVISSNNSHHGSLGKYFSFGNSAIYKTVNKSSVGQYTTKRGLTVVQKVKSNVIEDLVSKELKDGIESLGSVMPLLKGYIAPVFQIAHELQATVGDINLKKDKYSEFGI